MVDDKKLDMSKPEGDDQRVVADEKGDSTSTPRCHGPPFNQTSCHHDIGGAVPTQGSSGGLTLRFQDKLPHLPIPPLEDTMKRYLSALKGLQVRCMLCHRSTKVDPFDLRAVSRCPRAHQRSRARVLEA